MKVAPVQRSVEGTTVARSKPMLKHKPKAAPPYSGSSATTNKSQKPEL